MVCFNHVISSKQENRETMVFLLPCFQDASFKDLDHLTKTDTLTVYHLHEQNVLSRFGQMINALFGK